MENKILSNFKIQNECLKVEINPIGGSLASIFDEKSESELLWQGNAKAWKGRDIAIFPIVGRLKDGFYSVKNNNYEMNTHGLARYAEFTEYFKTESEIIIKMQSNEDTLKVYPFEFCFYVHYKLSGNNLTINYKVENLDNKTIYFGLGCHPGFVLDSVECENISDTSGNYLEFEIKQSLTQIEMDDSNVFVKGEKKSLYGNVIELTKDKFAKDAILFKGVKGGIKIIRKNGITLHFKINNPPIFAVWSHKQFGNFVCVEPWFGLPDNNIPVREISQKALINSLEVGKEFNYNYTLIVE